MGLFSSFFSSSKKSPQEKYEEKYSKKISDLISVKISEAVEMKRIGNFVKANDLYIELDNTYPDNPVILKSWAKILVCLGEYDKAINKYQNASKLYKQIGSGEYWQCDDQIQEIKNRYKNPDQFKMWVNAISGGSITNPKL